MPEGPPDFVFPPIRPLLKDLGIWLTKGKSQHFLVRPERCEAIAMACDLTDEHLALEIGAGLGNLTVELARRAGQVTSVEIDPAFTVWHNSLTHYFPNLDFVHGDFLKVDMNDLTARYPQTRRVAVGNLPYQITAPILFRLVESSIEWERIVIMIQREVAERLVAGAGTREASALTYKVAYLYDAEIVLRLPPEDFFPPPKVHSAVVVLTPRKEKLLTDLAHRDRVFDVVTASFRHRRKTMANCLAMSGMAPDRPAAEAALTAAGIDPKRRPEHLSLEDFLRLEEALRP
ncbi:16S rRNA (adenine(1518)-N(6)/adenine(1519)-N(6))-dimethyltransferase RsmA [bacterium]|nr:16S rRNA (adenine(1518)-N(6)/adenine(1519)-N(6))-dimethyltransferase RsmA [bacterium]